MAQVYKGTGTKIAKMVGETTAMDTAAQKVKALAVANAARHRKTGEYSGNFQTGRIRGKKGVTDREVYNDHPASGAIEFGHFAENRDGSLGKFVPGQFNLIRALKGQ